MKHGNTSISFLARCALVLLPVLALGHAGPAAQGLDEYCNFESPQVKPIAIASIPGLPTRQFLLACNTPDNTVEVYDITGVKRDSPEFVAAIPVGLEPVSVVYRRLSIAQVGTKNMLYTVNWLGDSVTFVEVWVNPSGVFKYEIVKEVRVTEPLEPQGVHAGSTDFRCDDEPMHLAVVNRPGEGQAGQFVVVTKRAASSYSLLHPFTGDFLPARTNSVASLPNGQLIANGGRNVIMSLDETATSENGQVVFTESPRKYPDIRMALKKPHTVLWRPGTDEFWVLGHQGGGSQAQDRFDFDFALWGVRTPAAGPNTYFGTGNLGSTNFNMAFNTAGDYLYVVGTEAQDQVTGNVDLEDTGTGFAKTMLYRVNMTTGIVNPRDLNTRSGAPLVDRQESLAHATDIAMYDDPATGNVYACVAGFHSSRFGMVRVQNSAGPLPPLAWTITTSSVEPSPAPREAGPRGVVVLSTGTQANDRAYLLNRLDGSISVIKLNGGAPAFLAKVAMQPSPEPSYIRDGRKFLYSTQFSGAGVPGGPGVPGSGSLESFVSCASCHVDGRTDGISWRLTAASQPPPLLSSVLSPPPQNPSDVVEVGILNYVLGGPFPFEGGFPSDSVPPDPLDDNHKGPMVTQSLQGLSNFEVGGTLFDGLDQDPAGQDPFDDLISNAPFHWRGDKDTFRHFNEAFVNLQGMSAAPNAVPEGGLTTAQMKAFERFINSIHYPPNPNQPLTREYSNDPEVGLNGLLGLDLFHTKPLPVGEDAGPDPVSLRSCVQCHMLPAGSNNRVTNAQGTQPLETAALRGVVQKESILRLSSKAEFPGNEQGILTGDFGLAHTGTNPNVKSLNGFVAGVFTTTLNLAERAALTQYVREFDSGVAPIVGFSFSLTTTPTSTEDGWITRLEQQADEANCGIAVYARVLDGGSLVTRGYWYDVTQASAKYKQAGAANFLSRATLVGFLSSGLSDDLIVFRATPLGSDRRVASFALASSDLPAGTIGVPSDVRIVGTTPNSANDPVVALTGNWYPESVFWPAGIGPSPLTLRVLHRFQEVILQQRRHDPPRRLQVVGTGLRTGAKLRLSLPNTATGPAYRTIELPLYPTPVETEESEPIWETDVEFDSRALYTMMLGGPADPNVDTVLKTGAGGSWPIPLQPTIEVEASNLPYATWSPKQAVPFPYPKVP